MWTKFNSEITVAEVLLGHQLEKSVMPMEIWTSGSGELEIREPSRGRVKGSGAQDNDTKEVRLDDLG